MNLLKTIKPNTKRNSLLLLLLLISLSSLYWQLTRLGYAVPLPELFDVICLNNCAEKNSQTISHSPLPNQQLLNYNKPITNIDKLDKTKVSILVEKSKYRLTVYYDRQPIKSYSVVFGGNPVDDKLKEGDKSTPEGVFKIKDFYPHASWSKFLWLDYPNKYSWRKHFQAKLNGKINWHDRVGSEIGIHGTPDNSLIDKKLNWTLGCVSLKNEDINELYQLVQKGTQVEIIR